MIIIADASPLVALAISGGLGLLEPLFDEIKVSEAVFDEVTRNNKPGASELQEYLQGKTANVSLENYVIGGEGLDEGELTSMALYKHLDADYLLIDEKAGRKVAKINNIRIIGSLGILIEAKRRGLVDEVKPHIEKLRDSNVHFSESILNHALTLSGEK